MNVQYTYLSKSKTYTCNYTSRNAHRLPEKEVCVSPNEVFFIINFFFRKREAPTTSSFTSSFTRYKQDARLTTYWRIRASPMEEKCASPWVQTIDLFLGDHRINLVWILPLLSRNQRTA